MKRYLIAFQFHDGGVATLFPKVFPLRNAHSPEEVTVPERTIFFYFVTADVDTAEELQSSFVAINIGQYGNVSSSIPYRMENNRTAYFIGKKKTIDGVECIYNSDMRTCIPTALLGDNYEVIDM